MGCTEASRYYGMHLEQEKVQSVLRRSQSSQSSCVLHTCLFSVGASIYIMGLVLSSRRFVIDPQGSRAAVMVREEINPSVL